jgi:hypothetical protein
MKPTVLPVLEPGTTSTHQYVLLCEGNLEEEKLCVQQIRISRITLLGTNVHWLKAWTPSYASSSQVYLWRIFRCLMPISIGNKLTRRQEQCVLFLEISCKYNVHCFPWSMWKQSCLLCMWLLPDKKWLLVQIFNKLEHSWQNKGI